MIKKKLTSAKTFVQEHKTGLAVLGTAAACTYLHLKQVKFMNERLREIGAYDEFWADEEEE